MPIADSNRYRRRHGRPDRRRPPTRGPARRPASAIAVRLAGLGAMVLCLWCAGAGVAFAAGWSVQAGHGAISAGQLSGVSCTSPRVCVAVGSHPMRLTASGQSFVADAPLVERWNGRTWSVQRAPGPVDRRNPALVARNSALVAVSCTSARACMAVGDDGKQGPLAELWNGRRWAIQRTPNADHRGGGLTGVSCGSARACIAVGTFDHPGRHGEIASAVVDRWSGNGWSSQTIQRPNGAADTSLSGVSCVSSTDCDAVGSVAFGRGCQVGQSRCTLLALVEHWNGSKWTVQRVPTLANTRDVLLTGVSCVTGDVCTAVGNLTNFAGDQVFAERWNGVNGSVRLLAQPAGATSASGRSVSCSGPRGCTAVVTSFNIANHEASLFERWTGDGWSLQRPARPSGAAGVGLAGVSCPSGIVCTAVGQVTGANGASGMLVERWHR
jgi:hypothetical protein